ncbi:MAG TPA: MlaD family protein [Caulobacteraceae bacterium]|jgi:phospholipid/cholesterol/gamma-HCH transport system substrate-binding protein|nr:MlaD family protein [Caulobacteraceae bacterium]
MERNANYALVGLISAIISIGLLVFVVWLAGHGLNRNFDKYNIVFQGPVRGLSQGAEVHFNGIKVGDVKRIYLDPKNAALVVAEAEVTSDVPVRADSVANLEPQGITGVNYIQISAGTPSKPLLRDLVPSGVIPVIHTKRDALGSLLAGGGDVLQRAVEALDRANRMLSDQNIKSITDTLSNVQAVTAELRGRKALFANAEKAMADADQAVIQFRELGKSSNALVNGDGKRAIAKLADAATQIEASAKSVHAMIENLNGPTADFAHNGLPKLSGAISSLQRATDHLDQAIGEIQNDPRGLLGKAPAKEVEVKP